MARYTDIVTDSNRTPLGGVYVYVYNSSKALATLTNDDGSSLSNPFVTGINGIVVFNAQDGNYFVQYQYGGRVLSEITAIVGNPPQYVGPTGPANSTYITKAALTSASVNNYSYIFAPPSGTDSGLAAGTFLYQTANAPYTEDGANVIKLTNVSLSVGALVRQKSETVKASSIALSSALAIAALDQSGNTAIDKGTFSSGVLTQRQQGVSGKGMVATTVNPATTTGPALRSLYNNGSWDCPVVADQRFYGIGTLQGSGFKFGPDSYAANAEYNGGIGFYRNHFENFDACIDRPYGSIGVTIENSTFEASNYHVKSIANVGTAGGGQGDVVHSGCLYLSRTHLAGAQLASIYIDGQNCNGSSQISINDCIGENIPGYTFFVKNFPSGFGGVPASRVTSFYRENTNTSGSITVGGITGAPSWAYLSNAGHWTFEDAALGTMQVLAATSVTTCNSDVSGLTSLTQSVDSTVTHYAARAYTGTVKGLTVSIGRIVNPTGLNGPSYRMPVPIALEEYTSQVVVTYAAQSVQTWNGTGGARNTVSQTGDAAIPGLYLAQDITLNAGETYLPPAFTIPANKFVVVKYIVRLGSGPAVTVQINGNSGMGGPVTIDNSSYKTLTWIVQNTGAAVTNESLYHTAGASTSVIRIAGYALKAFDTAQEALAYANNHTFPNEDRSAYTITNSTANRSLNADTTLTAAAATYNQTNTQSLIDQVAALQRVVATLIQDQRTGKEPK